MVVDGQIAMHRLEQLGRDEVWLREELENQGITDPSEVVVAQLDTNGEFFIDRKMDWEDQPLLPS